MSSESGEASDILSDFEAREAWLTRYAGRSLADILAFAEREGREVRVIGPDTLITEDDVSERLNLWVDGDGTLERITAG